MKLVSYRHRKDSAFRIGCLHDQFVIDLQESYRLLLFSNIDRMSMDHIDNIFPANPSLFFSKGSIMIEKAREAYAFVVDQLIQSRVMFERNQVLLGTPNPAPEKIICIGKNYADHAAEMKSEVPEYPVIFSKFNNALIGPEDTIQHSPLTSQLDYEVELTIIIGKEATHVSRDEANDYILGYTIANDISARDLQNRTSQWLKGKTLDRSTPIGPWVVTADEIKKPEMLAIRSYVNDEKRQESNTNKLLFDIPFLIEYITKIMTLQPGDMILTGTPDGVGLGMDPPHFLDSGDVVTSEIEMIGKLTNKVGKQM